MFVCLNNIKALKKNCDDMIEFIQESYIEYKYLNFLISNKGFSHHVKRYCKYGKVSMLLFKNNRFKLINNNCNRNKDIINIIYKK